MGLAILKTCMLMISSLILFAGCVEPEKKPSLRDNCHLIYAQSELLGKEFKVFIDDDKKIAEFFDWLDYIAKERPQSNQHSGPEACACEPTIILSFFHDNTIKNDLTYFSNNYWKKRYASIDFYEYDMDFWGRLITKEDLAKFYQILGI